MILQNVFATNAVCTPSQAAIRTGQYSLVNGVPLFNLVTDPLEMHNLCGQPGHEKVTAAQSSRYG